MTYDEAVRALGFQAGDSFENHLPVLREAESKLAELAESGEDEARRADYAHQLEMLRKAMAVVELGPETDLDAPKEVKKVEKSGGGRFVASLLLVGVLLGLGWGGTKLARQARIDNEPKFVEELLAQGQAAVEKKNWVEAEKKFQEALALRPNVAAAAEGLVLVAEGREVARRQQVAYLSGTAQSSIESREWDKAADVLTELAKLEPEHELLLPLQDRIDEGRIYDRIAGIVEQSEESIQEERWDDLAAHAVGLQELAPNHVDLPRYRKLSEEGLKLMAERRGKAHSLYEEAQALDEGVYSAEALEKVREAMRLHRQPEYQALYEKLSDYRRVLKVPGGFKTIAEAVAAARPNDTIRLAEGTYEEALVFERQVSLEGAGKDKTVIVFPAARASVITVGEGVENGRISGLSLRQTGFALGKERFPILAVRKGLLSVEDCHLQKGSGHGIAVLDGAKVRLRDVRVSQCGWDGLAVQGDGSHAEVESSRFDANLHHGIDAWDGGTVSMRKSRCSGNGLAGAVLMSGGKPFLLEQCTMDANREVGVMISNGASADLISNRVTVNLLGGIVARDSGTVVKLRGNQVSKNEKIGVMIDQHSTLEVFEKNVVEDNVGKQTELTAKLPPRKEEVKD